MIRSALEIPMGNYTLETEGGCTVLLRQSGGKGPLRRNRPI